MVAKSDIERINELYGQYQQYQDAMAIMSDSPRITAFIVEGEVEETVEGAGPDEAQTRLMNHGVSVSAEGIQYPPQMLDAIRQQVDARIKSINDELASLGVTPE